MTASGARTQNGGCQGSKWPPRSLPRDPASSGPVRGGPGPALSAGRPGHVTRRPSQSARSVAVRAARASRLASLWWKAPLGAAGAAAALPPAAPAAAMDYGEGEGAPPPHGQGPAAATAAAVGPGRVSKWQRPLCSAQDGAPLTHVLVLLPAASAGLGELRRRPAAGGAAREEGPPRGRCGRAGGAGGGGARRGERGARGRRRAGGAGRAGGSSGRAL